jgi:hypothetical protein
MDVGSMNLGERAEPPAGIISVVGWPGVGGFLLQQFMRIKCLGDGYSRQQSKQETKY